MRIAVLYNGSDVAEWQHRALAAIRDGNEFVYLVNTHEGPTPRRRLDHAFYYALNMVTIRNPLTRRVALSPPSQAAQFRFTPARDGAWAALPPDALAWLRAQRVDAVVKFGLNLLRIPDDAPPILSYHHGDPRTHRGRPAGFYEVRDGEPFVGQVVQVLSNRLDGGRMLAFAQTRAYPHSYRKTLIEQFATSPALLPVALANLRANRALALEPSGKNFRLPTNGAVVRFVAARFRAIAKRLLYGAFVEKRWQVSRVSFGDITTPDAVTAVLGNDPGAWRTMAIAAGYSFYADCFFFGGEDDLLVEALNARTGKGELLRLTTGHPRKVRTPPGTHTSYPASIVEGGVRYVIPETSGWAPPTAFVVEGDTLRAVAALKIDAKRLIDPTVFAHEGRTYLFGTTDSHGVPRLDLWFADSLFAPFARHPASPIRIGPRGSRMAGEIMPFDERLYRLGQDCRRNYGDGILWFRIERLSPTEYEEVPAGELAFRKVQGPHTLNRCGNSWLFDWYVERRSPFAGVRRLLNRL